MPLIVFFGLIIKLKYPGPFFYKQLREGKNGKHFYIWKLRTMVSDSNKILQHILKDEALAREWRAFGCLKNDPRIAGAAAKIARQLSIDELPQLFNILKGEMAFIGPRLLEIYLADTLFTDTRIIRNTVKPGITGLWQIGPRSEINIRQMQLYDKLYIRKKSLGLDIYILVMTIKVIFKKTGN